MATNEKKLLYYKKLREVTLREPNGRERVFKMVGEEGNRDGIIIFQEVEK